MRFLSAALSAALTLSSWAGLPSRALAGASARGSRSGLSPAFPAAAWRKAGLERPALPWRAPSGPLALPVPPLALPRSEASLSPENSRARAMSAATSPASLVQAAAPSLPTQTPRSALSLAPLRRAAENLPSPGRDEGISPRKTESALRGLFSGEKPREEGAREPSSYDPPRAGGAGAPAGALGRAQNQDASRPSAAPPDPIVSAQLGTSGALPLKLFLTSTGTGLALSAIFSRFWPAYAVGGVLAAQGLHLAWSFWRARGEPVKTRPFRPPPARRLLSALKTAALFAPFLLLAEGMRRIVAACPWTFLLDVLAFWLLLAMGLLAVCSADALLRALRRKVFPKSSWRAAAVAVPLGLGLFASYAVRDLPVLSEARPGYEEKLERDGRLDDLTPASAPASAAKAPASPLARELAAAREKGARFLRAHQEEDGSWRGGTHSLFPRKRDGKVIIDLPFDNGQLRAAIAALASEALERFPSEEDRAASRKGAEAAFSRMLQSARYLGKKGDFYDFSLRTNDRLYALAYGLPLLLRHYDGSSGGSRDEYARAVRAALGEIAGLETSYMLGRTVFRRGYVDLRELWQPASFQLGLLLNALNEAEAHGFKARDVPGLADLRERIIEGLEDSRQGNETYPYELSKYNTMRSRLNGAARTVLIDRALYRAGRSGLRQVREALALFFEREPALGRVPARDPGGSWHNSRYERAAPYFYLFGCYWAAQALRELPPSEAKPKAEALARSLLERQLPDGSWVDSPEVAGYAYGTASVMLSLEALEGILAAP